MIAVKGVFQDGIVLPLQPVDAVDGQDVIITFLESGNGKAASANLDADWDELLALAESCAVESGISDLAHQHQHYLYGKPKTV